MAMAPVSALELPRKVGDLGQLLRARLEIAQLDLAGRELVSDDDREMRSLACGALELPRQRPLREIGRG